MTIGIDRASCPDVAGMSRFTVGGNPVQHFIPNDFFGILLVPSPGKADLFEIARLYPYGKVWMIFAAANRRSDSLHPTIRCRGLRWNLSPFETRYQSLLNPIPADYCSKCRRCKLDR
jgi:hypothetical protein